MSDLWVNTTVGILIRADWITQVHVEGGQLLVHTQATIGLSEGDRSWEMSPDEYTVCLLSDLHSDSEKPERRLVELIAQAHDQGQGGIVEVRDHKLGITPFER